MGDVAAGGGAEAVVAVGRGAGGGGWAGPEEAPRGGGPLRARKGFSPPRRSPPRARSAPPTLSVLHMPRPISRPARPRHVKNAQRPPSGAPSDRPHTR